MTDAPLTYFDPQPAPADCPARLPSPFAGGPPHPIALRAAGELRGQLAAGAMPSAPRGKMFGVLVVADANGRTGYLRGFSGMLEGRWHRQGFVGPVFDEPARARMWPAGEAELLEFDRQLATVAARTRAARDELALLREAHSAETARLLAAHGRKRDLRGETRAALAEGGDEWAAAGLHALEQQSRGDGAEMRAHRRHRRLAEEHAALPLRALQERERHLKVLRAARSCELLEQLYAGYRIASARGELRPLRELFAPEAPPGGSADCAGPKLFAHATRAGLRPIALAEFWWGPPPVDGGRAHGRYYPSCRGKCGPVLRHMLDGLGGDPLPTFGDGGEIPADEPRTVYEDRWLLVVSKPEGLLSVPGRSPLLRDAVSTRLAARYPQGEAPLLVHRLDLDTSGLLLAAKDRETYVALQRQFSERAVEKRYVAWLDGMIAADRGAGGVVDLPLRGDLEDRPRQLFDPVHGKPASTTWRVDRTSVGRTPVAQTQLGRTRVFLFPSTGRTHQLRVHAAHPRGIGVPIVGDRLYGVSGGRLLLHAESLAFNHPHTSARLAIESPAPF